MSLHSANSREKAGNPSIEYFGIPIECSSTTSVRLLRGILFRDKREVKDVIKVERANVNDLCRCWATDQDQPFASYTLTLLSLAVRFSTNRIVRSLLQRGADPNVKCDMTPLGVAVQRNNKKLVALLLDSGADINLLTHPVVKWKSSGNGDHLMQTPLHIACRKGLVAMTSYLLLKQAATDVIDGSGKTPANVVRTYGHRQVEELILREVACRTLMSVRPALCRDENIRFATHYERSYTTQLILACFHNDTKKASCLISYGANINASDASLNTALHYACATGNQKLARLLLKHEAKVDALNKEKKRPIEVALEFGYMAIVFILIQHKCVLPYQLLFATNSSGNTLLHIACKQNRIPVVKQLIKRGAFLNVVNQKGKSPIHYAWQSGSIELKRILLDYVFQYCRIETVERWQRFDVTGVEWFKRFVELASYRMLSKVVSQDWNGSLSVTGEEVHGNLCFVCGKLSPDASYLLLSRGMFDFSMLLASCCSRPCKANCTSLLHIACCMKSTEHWKIVEQLIKDGADVNAVDNQGNTPLHLECCYGSDRGYTSFMSCQSIITTLLDNGASPYVVNDGDKTALWYAFWKNNSKLVRWLILQKEIDVDAEVLHGFNGENTLLLMLAADEVDDRLLWRLVERSARINVPLQANFDRSHSASLPYRKQPRLLDVLASSNNWSLIRKLVEVGCCDFSTETFRLLLQPYRWSLNNERFMCSRIHMWKWFLLAGLGQFSEFSTHTDTFQREFYFEWKSKYDSQESTSDEDDSDDEYDDIDVICHPHWTSAGTTTNTKTRMTLNWLKHDMENPASLSRLCVYTIRRQLIDADPDGTSIFPSIDKLPLPTRLKDSLKLRDIECDAECFNQQQLSHVGLFDDVFSPYLFLLPLRPSYAFFHSFSSTRSFLLNRLSLSFIQSCSCSHCAKESTFHVKEEQSVEKIHHAIQRSPEKRNCTVEKIRKPLVSHSVRRSRTLVQPRRHH